VSARSQAALVACQQQSIGSVAWRSQFHGLFSCPKAEVIDYVKHACQTGDERARYWCYVHCADHGWDDLIEQARQDGTAEDRLLFGLGPNPPSDTSTLRAAAIHYLEQCGALSISDRSPGAPLDERAEGDLVR
jgi:hypothetical protein